MCVVYNYTPRPQGMVIRQTINIQKLNEHTYSDIPILYFGQRPVQFVYNLIKDKFTWHV
jgi:hypothetical protein